MTLTQEQHTVIVTKGNLPITVDGVECVLIRSDLFSRLSSLLGEDWTHDEMRQSLARSSQENGWDDKTMDIYNAYEDTP